MTENICLIDAPRFASAHQQGRVRFLIDVRSPAEFRTRHVAGARNIPLDQLAAESLEQQLRQEGLQHGAELFLICQSGQRARRAAELLQRRLPGLQVVDGGTQACLACGLPTEQAPGRAIDLQRQVQIAAGSLVLLGVALGTWVHPAGYGLAAFVGAGLSFAGLSGTCAMALLLARMPWNR